MRRMDETVEVVRRCCRNKLESENRIATVADLLNAQHRHVDLIDVAEPVEHRGHASLELDECPRPLRNGITEAAKAREEEVLSVRRSSRTVLACARVDAVTEMRAR